MADMPTDKTFQKEIKDLCDRIRDLPCPVCGNNTQLLNGTTASKVVSFILYSHHTDRVRVACPQCLDRYVRQANIITAIFGWWGFVLGPFLTIQAFLMNRTVARYHHSAEANIHLIGFVLIKREEL